MRFHRRLRFFMGLGLLLMGLLWGSFEAYHHVRVVLMKQQLQTLTVREDLQDVSSALIVPNVLNLRAINKDYVAWISVDSTTLDYPIVQGIDNAFYLNHDFKQAAHPFGSIFLDHRNRPDFSQAHTIIYGHAARFDSMFGILRRYRNFEYLQRHRFIDVHLDGQMISYQIFSVQVVDANVTRLNPNLDESEIFAVYQHYLKRSMHQLDLPNFETLQLLTLVSCVDDVDNGRIMVHAVRVNR